MAKRVKSLEEIIVNCAIDFGYIDELYDVAYDSLGLLREYVEAWPYEYVDMDRVNLAMDLIETRFWIVLVH
jgi:hypothetical protein